jgi:hypothetical protein
MQNFEDGTGSMNLERMTRQIMFTQSKLQPDRKKYRLEHTNREGIIELREGSHA